MAETMRAIAISGPGGPEVLIDIETERPQPGPGEILIKVDAAGVNGPDLIQRTGGYPPPKGASPLPGLEVSGTVVATGSGSQAWALGDKVCALTPGGGYAEYCSTHESHALPVPGGLSMIEAAGLPETFFTVWHNVFERGGLKSGETFLVHGGSSGIGTTAIQLATAFGATVFATAGSREKCEACEKLGAKRAINYREEDFVEVVKAETGKRGADLILDMVGGPYIAKNYSAAAMDGRIAQIAFLKGSKVEVDYMRLMVKRLTHTGSTLRPQSVADKARMARALSEKVWPLLEKGSVAPLIHATFPLAEAAAAHRMMEEGNHIGKIVLSVGS